MVSVLIDNIDINATFGAYLLTGSLATLLEFPPLKELPKIDWAEFDGYEVDASNPVLDSKEVTLAFAFSGLYADFHAFVDLLNSSLYHDIEVLGRTFRLRFVKADQVDYDRTLVTARFQFADDSPLKDYVYRTPVSSLPTDERYLIDSKPFTDYGVRVLKGLSSLVKPGEVKGGMARNIKSQPGVIADENAGVKYQAKDVTLECLWRASGHGQLWRNWYSLLYTLTRPGEHVLTVNEFEQDFPFVYKSMKAKAFYPDDNWLAFDLTLTLTKDFRINPGDLVFVDESDVLLIDEAEENDAIDAEKE